MSLLMLGLKESNEKTLLEILYSCKSNNVLFLQTHKDIQIPLEQSYLRR